MLSLIHVEIYKLWKSKIIGLLLLVPASIIFIGVTSNLDITAVNKWFTKLITINLSYGLLLLPLLTGVFAAFICRYEHAAGGWKQLFTLPVTRTNIYFAKLIVLACLLLISQLLYLVGIFIVGKLLRYTEPFPIEIIWKAMFGGWLASLPLITLQLGLSMFFKSFVMPFALNVMCTLPAILIVNSERFGPYYPWNQPFLMMNIGGDQNTTFFIPWQQLILVVGGSFLLFFLASCVYINKKEI
ncbi:ABC transporter permease subunit [Erwinia sp. CPCC 100877]|nr:ABC transporter permease subunit [Erwinia sp. CPCC 100877]